MFANTAYFPPGGYPQSQAPATSGMNASQTPIPDHSQLNMSQPPPMASGFPQEYADALGKTKRKQVKNACVNCQKACKKCDEQRPCPRCVKYGLTETCVDSVRKERKKGIKRGPYKKRKQGGTTSGDSSSATTPNMSMPPISNGMYAAPPSTGVAGVSRGANAPIPYQAFGNTAHFETFPNFPNGAHQYLPYNILNNMNNIIQQAAANANANGAPKDNSQQQTQQQQQVQQQSAKQNEDGENKPTTETDENGKLSILSQLCTAVLDRAPTGEGEGATTDSDANKKQEIKAETVDAEHETTAQNATHSRESTSNNNGSTTAGSEPNPSDEHQSANGSHYGTPESSSETGGNN